MKQILLAVLMLFMFQGVVFADDVAGEGEGGDFATQKAKVLENIAKRRSLLSELESCVGSANSREDMKSCRQKHQQELDALHPKRKEMKEKHRERKKDRH